MKKRHRSNRMKNSEWIEHELEYERVMSRCCVVTTRNRMHWFSNTISSHLHGNGFPLPVAQINAFLEQILPTANSPFNAFNRSKFTTAHTRAHTRFHYCIRSKLVTIDACTASTHKIENCQQISVWWLINGFYGGSTPLCERLARYSTFGHDLLRTFSCERRPKADLNR